MATAEGYLRRLTRRLTEDPEQLDVEELSDEAVNTGALKAIDNGFDNAKPRDLGAEAG